MWSRTDRRDGYAAGRSEAFQPRRHVDTISVDVVTFHNDVADVDAYAEFDPPLFGHIDVALAHPALDLGGTGNRVHDARELDKHPVAGELDDAPLVLGDLGVDHLVAMRLQSRQRPGLVQRP